MFFDEPGTPSSEHAPALEVELAMLAELGLSYELVDYRRRFLGMADGPFVAALDADRRARQGVGLPEAFGEEMHARRPAVVAERLSEVAGAV
jgi:hypothetical protein